MEEAKIPYDMKIYHRKDDKMAPSELKKIHPLGKAPVITIEASNLEKPLVLAESGAIFEYLGEFGRRMERSVCSSYVQATI